MCGTSSMLYLNFLSNAPLMKHFPIAGYLYKKIHRIPIEKQSESLKAKSSLACHLSIVGTIGSVFKSSMVGATIFGLSAILSYKTVLETEKFERLEGAISSLNKINSQLKRSHKKFKQNSDQMIDSLKSNNKHFESQNEALKEEIEKLQELIAIARKTNNELFALQQRHGVTANVYEEIGKNLERVKDSFDTHEVNLGEKIRELSREICRLREIKA
jgi:septal ring factor EnvC (AmiA/AmiB activator)